MDIFAKGRVPLGITGRVSYSYVSSRRTDPNSGIVTRAPFDVTHSMTAVADRSLFGGLRASIAYRYATGRPFTPVAGATYDSQQQVYVPNYGAPLSERLAGVSSPGLLDELLQTDQSRTAERGVRVAHEHARPHERPDVSLQRRLFAPVRRLELVRSLGVLRRHSYLAQGESMKLFSLFAACGLAVSTAAIPLTAQNQLTGTAKWADSASREIEAANAVGDLDRLTTAAAMIDRVLTVTPNDPLLLYYRSLALYRSATLYMGRKKNDEAKARAR